MGIALDVFVNFGSMKRKDTAKQMNGAIDLQSVNREARTFEVSFASEVLVRRNGWEESYDEQLAVARECMRTERLDSGSMALIDSHNSWSSIEAQMGVITGWRIDDATKLAYATIQFSSQERWAGIFNDVAEGIIRNISVGYRVWKYERIKQNPTDKNEIPVYRAIDWEPRELSFVTVPADPSSAVRKDGEQHEVQILNRNNNTMHENEIRAAVTAAGLPATVADDMISRSLTIEQAQAEIAQKRAVPAAPPAPVAPAQPTPAAAPVRSEADIQAAERQRIADINSAAVRAGLGHEVGIELSQMERNGNVLTVDEARAIIIDRIAEMKDPKISGPGAAGGASARGGEIPNTMRAMEEALMERAKPGSVSQFSRTVEKKERALDVKSRDFLHTNMMGMMRQALEINGIRAASYSPAETYSTYLRMVNEKRNLGTTDLPDLFTSVQKRFLRMFYEPVVPDWMQFSTQVPADDFRIKTGIKVDSAVTFEEITENGEYKESTIMSNEKATIQLRTYGRKMSISRKTIINDDLSVLVKAPQAVALGWNQFQSKKVWALITGNAKTPDGKAIFHADHGNLASVAASINDAALSLGRVAMRRQKSPEGNELDITPMYLLVPPELQTKAEKLLRTISPNTVDAVNIWGTLVPVTNNYLTDPTAWYLIADHKSITEDGIVHAYLTGQEGLYTETQIDFDSDNLVTKARGDFDAALWGHRGWYKNAGSAESTD